MSKSSPKDKKDEIWYLLNTKDRLKGKEATKAIRQALKQFYDDPSIKIFKLLGRGGNGYVFSVHMNHVPPGFWQAKQIKR